MEHNFTQFVFLVTYLPITDTVLMLLVKVDPVVNNESNKTIQNDC